VLRTALFKFGNGKIKTPAANMYVLLKTQIGNIKGCPVSAVEPTSNTDTCDELCDETWTYGETTFARTSSGKRVAVEPLYFAGKFLNFHIVLIL
jgi:hypothetical protein